MGQKECLELLEKEKKWFTLRQIQEIIDIHTSSVHESLRRLERGGFIEIKKNPEKHHGNLYRFRKED